jgi:hypothetical protein
METAFVRAKRNLKAALLDARSAFIPWWKRTIVVSALIHGAGSTVFFGSNANLSTGVAVLVALLWGLILGAILGAFVGVYAMLVRIAGRSALIPVVVVPLCMMGAWMIGDDWVMSAWDAAKDYAREVGRGPGIGGHGHPILLVILLPLFLIIAMPFAVMVGWAAFLSCMILLAGFFIGLAVSLPPMAVGFAWKAICSVSRETTNRDVVA